MFPLSSFVREVPQGYIVDEHTVEVTSPEGEKRRYTADNILVATGAHAFKIDIPGKEHTITSDEIMCLSEQPKRLVVIGAGYIALEFASIFNGTLTCLAVLMSVCCFTSLSAD